MDESRRSLIKQAGLGAGAVWATPLLTSLATPAAAGTPGPGLCTPSVCLALPGGGIFPCRAGDPSFPNCVCAGTGAGGTVCVNPFFGCPTADLACGPGNACPEGFVCITNTCCLEATGSSSVCISTAEVSTCSTSGSTAGRAGRQASIFG
jgi:hypothetical protein